MGTLRWRVRALSLAVLVVVTGARAAHAAPCEGPPECCPVALAHTGAHPTVTIGVVLVGVSNLAERAGTFDADFYLYEQWQPRPGFTPQTELTNEVDRHATEFDQAQLRDGACIRSRRIRTTLRAAYDLMTFPFDHQRLAIALSDDEFPASELTYAAAPYALGFADGARAALSSWRVDEELTYDHGARAFPFEHGEPSYDTAEVSFEVSRHTA
jgi:hypothetical protein